MIQNGRIDISAEAGQFYAERDAHVQSSAVRTIAFMLNVPWTLCGLLLGLLSLPVGLRIEEGGLVVMKVKKIWLSEMFMGNRVVGATAGSVIVLRDGAESSAYAHERVHIRQFEAMPFLFPLFYSVELMRHGYLKNKYEEEAYWLTQDNHHTFQ